MIGFDPAFVQNGGRGAEIKSLCTVWMSRLPSPADSGSAACLCISALRATILICGGQFRIRSRSHSESASSWSVQVSLALPAQDAECKELAIRDHCDFVGAGGTDGRRETIGMLLLHP